MLQQRRPKSALRRRLVDRDEDSDEGEDIFDDGLASDEDDDEEDGEHELVLYQNQEDEEEDDGIEFHDVDREEDEAASRHGDGVATTERELRFFDQGNAYVSFGLRVKSSVLA